jgi:hypothetical protein
VAGRAGVIATVLRNQAGGAGIRRLTVSSSSAAWGPNATSGHLTSFPEAFCFGWLTREEARRVPGGRRAACGMEPRPARD